MMTLSVIANLFWMAILFAGVFLLPGYVLLKPVANRLFAHEAIFYCVIFSAITVGTVFYFTAMVLGFAIKGVYFHCYHVLLIALIVTWALYHVGRRFGLAPISSSPLKPFSRRKKLALIAVLAIISFYYIMNFDDRNYSDCIYNGTLVNLVDLHIFSDFTFQLQGEQARQFQQMAQNRLIGLVVNRGQREGSITFLISFVPTFKLYGFNLAYYVIHALIFLGAFSIIFRLFGNYYAALITAILIAMHPILQGQRIVDENAITLLSLLALFNWVSIKDSSPIRLALLTAWSIIMMQELAAPLLAFAIVYLLLNRHFPKSMLAFFITLFIAGIPTLVHHTCSMGSPFAHQSWADFSPITHHFLGHAFQYRGLLNWPFFDYLVRTPFTPAPTLILFPLYFIKQSGYLMASMALAGIFLLLWKRHRDVLPHIAFTLVVFSYLAIQGNWMEPKKMGVSLHMFTIFVIGLGYFLTAAIERFGFRGVSFAFLAALSINFGFVRSTKLVEFPPDPRTDKFLPSLYDLNADQYRTMMANYENWIGLSNTPEMPDDYRFERRRAYNISLWPNTLYLFKRAKLARYRINLEDFVRDLLFPDFAYYKAKPNRLGLDALGSQIILKNPFTALAIKSGCPSKKRPRIFSPSEFADPKHPGRIRIPLNAEWIKTTPVQPVISNRTLTNIEIAPGKTYIVQTTKPMYGGVYRTLIITSNQWELDILTFYRKNLDPQRFAKQGLPTYMTEDPFLVLQPAYPCAIFVMEVRRAFPRMIYNWDGTIKINGELFISPAIHNKR